MLSRLDEAACQWERILCRQQHPCLYNIQLFFEKLKAEFKPIHERASLNIFCGGAMNIEAPLQAEAEDPTPHHSPLHSSSRPSGKHARHSLSNQRGHPLLHNSKSWCPHLHSSTRQHPRPHNSTRPESMSRSVGDSESMPESIPEPMLGYVGDPETMSVTPSHDICVCSCSSGDV